jgi:hypothetical protein
MSYIPGHRGRAVRPCRTRIPTMPLVCECCGQTIKAKRQPKAPKAPTFSAYDDFVPVYNAARAAAVAALGERWYLAPGASAVARLPAKWVRCQVYGRVSAGPRDVRLPAAQFWPAGMLPAGPDYAEPYAIEPALPSLRQQLAEHDIRLTWQHAA